LSSQAPMRTTSAVLLAFSSAAGLRVPAPSMAAMGRTWLRTPQFMQLFQPGVVVEAPASKGKKHALVKDYMTKVDTLTVLEPSMSLEEAACSLAESGVSGAPVVGPCMMTGERRLLGVLSQKDLLYSAAGRGRARFVTTGPRSQRVVVNTQRLQNILKGDVGSVMSVRPTTVGPTTSVQDAAALLLDMKISRVPVVSDEGGLVGLLSISDIMSAVTNSEVGCHVFD